MYLNIINTLYGKSTANITLNGEKLKIFLQKSGIRQAGPILFILFDVVLEVLARVIKQGKVVKGIQIRKEEATLPLFADFMKYI